MPHGPDSGKPRGREDHSNYSFRRMALDQVEVMAHLGFDTFAVPTLMALSAFPAFFTALLGVYFLGLKLQWFPIQHALANKVQAVWLKTLPVIPLFVGPRWSTYSTKYFHGFNSVKNFYGDPIFTTFPDNVLSFTRICPGAQTGP